MTLRTPLACLITCLVALVATAQEEPVSLFTAGHKTLGWTLNTGPEFPGAKGSLTADADETYREQPSLKLRGDFRGGGGYVATYFDTPAINPRTLRFALKTTGKPTAIFRIADASGQVHQIRYKLDDTGEWQDVEFPVHAFFKNMGTTQSVPGVINYEKWGGPNDGKFHPPIKQMGVLLSKRYTPDEAKVADIWIGTPELIPLVERPRKEVRKTLQLAAYETAEELDWAYDNGRDVKGGGAGSLELVPEGPEGRLAMRLSGDFTKGGGYVQALKTLELPPGSTVSELRFKVRSTSAATYALRLIDGSGQVHQKKGMTVTTDGTWQQVTIVPTEYVGGEHWGGAKDGAWHDPLAKLAIMVNLRSDKANNTPVLDIADVEIDATVSVEQALPALALDFSTPLADGWQITGDVAVADGSLRLRRTEATMDAPLTSTGPAFASSPGAWEFALRTKAALTSPDASFAGKVKVEFLNLAGRVIAGNELVSVFGSHDWADSTLTVEAPAGTAAARLKVGVDKAIGDFWVDDVTATRVVQDVFAVKRIERILFSTANLGNMIYPDDPVQVTADVECLKPLNDLERQTTWVLRDYWGAEQGEPIQVTLEPAGRNAQNQWVYRGVADFSGQNSEHFKYYEAHIQIPQRDQDPFLDYTAFARLPEAEANSYEPALVPFTSRNWDNRVPAYFHMSNRIGIRTIGLWGHFSHEPPYEPKAPRVELAVELGMDLISRVPTIMIEGHRGNWEAYTEEVMRAGTKRFLETYIPMGLTMIALGNEPRGDEARIREQVESYKWVYETMKEVDPSIIAVGSSMGPVEEYFEAGFYKYLDVYDFHTYGNYRHKETVFKRYHELFEKYDCAKPIWSTELGLNSQGMTRHAVAMDLMKTVPTFFAMGGENMSWFGILYPDPSGRGRGSSGDAHNVFDSRYSRYSPRLDAVMYYTMVNGVGAKKFVKETRYSGEIRGFHFRGEDGKNMQIYWSEGADRAATIALPGLTEVTVVRLDSSRQTFRTHDGSLSVGMVDEPVMLLYDDPAPGQVVGLPESLGEPRLALQGEIPTASAGGSVELPMLHPGVAIDDLHAIVPYGWEASIVAEGEVARVRVQIPAGTGARTLQLRIQAGDPAAPHGEIIIPILITD